MGTFSESVRANIKLMLQEIDARCYAISYDLFMTVIKYSPTQPDARYSKGEFINNWMIGVNSFNTTTTAARSVSGTDSKNQIVSAEDAKAFLGKDGFLSFSNNVSYARNVEYDGWKKSENPRWSGLILPYAPVATAFIEVAPKYK